ncbi:hypothetical protein GGI02_005650, partial [Coemansia sp. RSA 2322]
MTDSDYSRNLQQLTELFPDMDAEVVDMVLRDNAGLVDPSVNVLLSMNDPDFKPDPAIQQPASAEARADAEYARRLAESEIATRSRSRGPSREPPASRAPDRPPRQQPQSQSQSKIRSMLRFGRSRSSSSPALDPPLPPPLPDQVIGDTLESDFSDAAESEEPPGAEARAEQSAALNTGVLDLLDDGGSDSGLAAAYAPLSPARMSPRPVAAPPVAGWQGVDMENPFAVPSTDERDDEVPLALLSTSDIIPPPLLPAADDDTNP